MRRSPGRGERVGGPRDGGPPALGLHENWRQFALLVLVNAFVGAMVGLERSVLPLLASDAWHRGAWRNREKRRYAKLFD